MPVDKDMSHWKGLLHRFIVVLVEQLASEVSIFQLF